MPEVPEDTFFQALVELVKLDQGWVPEQCRKRPVHQAVHVCV